MKDIRTFLLCDHGDMSVGIMPWESEIKIDLSAMEEIDQDDLENFDIAMARTLSDFFDCHCFTPKQIAEGE